MADVLPWARTIQRSHPGGLVWREDREPDPVLGEQLEREQVRRRLTEPHPLGFASEAMLEVTQAPPDLCAAIALVSERHDEVVVHLRDRRAMAPEALLT